MLGGTILSAKQFLNFSLEPRIGLYKLANELRVNPYT